MKLISKLNMNNLKVRILFLMITLFSFAQNETTVTGKMIDSKTQKPISGVKVLMVSNQKEVISINTGEFKFENPPIGTQTLIFSQNGYIEQSYLIEVEKGKKLDIGSVVMEEDAQVEQQLSLVTITESDLGDDNSGSESTSGLLQSSRDTYQQAAAFNWGQARFRMRGLDNAYGTTMINGVVMNKLYDGRPQWSNWGGLNDATRNQEFTLGTAPSDYTFGGILGTQEINTRASLYRKGNRISFSGTNTNYSWRAMGTVNSGLLDNGWAYSISGSRRWAQEGYFEGTDYAANSLFASVEKRFNDKHSLNFTSIYAQNSRGKSSPNTKEVTDIKGIEYNSYWGWQNGKKRNSRDKNIEEPILILSHYWNITPKTTLNTNVAYQLGEVGNTRLEYPGANNPDPTYYKYLPSYFLNLDDTTGAQLAYSNFLANGQINWNSLYLANQASSTGNAAVMLTEQINADKQISANSILFSDLSDNIKLNASASYRNLNSHNYAEITDLLGAQYFTNVDSFYTGDQAQLDLNNPNAILNEGDKFGYNYKLMANVFDAFTQFKFTYNVIDFYLAQSFSRSEYQREGLYKSGLYPSNSFGKSNKVVFENFGFKGGMTLKLTSQHLFDFNGAYMSKAPNLRNVFANARKNNNITQDIQSERVASADASYIIKTPKFKSRLTGFFSKIQNETSVAFFFAEGIGEDTDSGEEDAFVTEIITGQDRKNIGVELGLEYQITSTIKASLAGSYGEYIYDNNPTLTFTNDAVASATNTNPITNLGQTYTKGYRQGGMPQQAASFGLEYRNPNFWWVGANINYLGATYLDFSKVLRTDNFVVDSDGLGYSGATPETVGALLKQEKFDTFNLLNVVGGKSWKVNTTTFGFFASINNVLDQVYKTGGFEQSRKATFPDYQADNANGTPSFGSKYFYGYGRTYFVNLYINF